MNANEIIQNPINPTDTNMWRFLHFVGKNHYAIDNNYQLLYQWSIDNPAAFWAAVVDFLKIEFATPPTEILLAANDMLNARWFAGAKLNYTEQLLKNSPPDKTALIVLNETDGCHKITYQELIEHTAFCRAGLEQTGIGINTRVAAILPNNDFTLTAFLATAAIGAIWSACAPEFGDAAILDRLGQIEPEILFISEKHYYNGKEFIDYPRLIRLAEQIPSIRKVIICTKNNITPRESAKIMLWQDFIDTNATPAYTNLPFDHPLYILFSSGTTGKPKCIVHSAGSMLLQHLKELCLHSDLTSADNLFFYTTCGWMMWNWMVTGLYTKACLTLYDGSAVYPSTAHLFAIIDKYDVSIFGTSAKFISVVEKSGIHPRENYPMRRLHTILSTGSPLLPQNFDFVYQQIKNPVRLCSISGGTDIASCFALGNPLLPIRRGELQGPGLGMHVEVYNDQGESVIEETGELVCTQAFIGMPAGFWQDDDKKRYHAAYFSRFPNVWTHGDYARITNHGGVVIVGRSDTVLNPGGVRIGTAEIYRQIETMPEIIDSVVIGQNYADDVRILLFVKLAAGVQISEKLIKKIKQSIREGASPRHVPAIILEVPDIPRTINGKTVELAVRQTVAHEPVKNLHSIANPEALKYFANREELQ